MRRAVLGALAAWLALVGRAGAADAQVDASSGTARRARPFEFITKVPRDLKDFGLTVIRRDQLKVLAGVAALTGVLVWQDQSINDRTQAFGGRIHISHARNQRMILSTKIGDSNVGVVGPYDLGSGLYFLGDGWLHLGIAGGFFAVGGLRKDPRALRTASHIVESYLASGVIVQVLKRSTGRESPSDASRPGGRWTPFPSFAAYQAHTPHYDAFPSGHLTSATAVVTVIANDYPDNRYIKPIGYTLLAGLSFQMLNNNVHWAADYPLAIYIGYVTGNIVAPPRRRSSLAGRVELLPFYTGRAAGVRAQLRF